MIALSIFLVTFAGIAVTRIPWLKVDRPVAAFLGAVAMVLFGVLTLTDAINAVDWGTIALLLGMMVLIAVLQQDGYTEALAATLFGRARTGTQLLVIIVAFTGVASAFLVNDAVVLVATPLIIAFCRGRGLNPLPFLLAEAMASNIGSAATITGNPQNVLIGLRSDISFGRFLVSLLPISVLASVALVFVTRWSYRRDLARPFAATPAETAQGYHHLRRVRPSGVILLCVVVAFVLSPWLDVKLPVIALTGAALALLTSRHNPQETFRRVDWVLLLFFTSLFIVIHGAVQEGLFDRLIDGVKLKDNLAGIGSIHGVSLVMSQLISNVPFTVLMLPIMQGYTGDLLWLSLAAGATLAGNLTLIGAVANLIVAEGGAKDGVRISFWDFFRLGLPVTAISMVISIGVLWLEHSTGLAA